MGLTVIIHSKYCNIVSIVHIFLHKDVKNSNGTFLVFYKSLHDKDVKFWDNSGPHPNWGDHGDCWPGSSCCLLSGHPMLLPVRLSCEEDPSARQREHKRQTD